MTSLFNRSFSFKQYNINMKAFVLLLAIAASGVRAMPDLYGNKLPLLRPQWQQQEQQLPQVEQLQWEQQWSHPQQQWQQIKLQDLEHQLHRQQPQPPVWPWPPQFPDFTTSTTTKTPAVLDPRCPKVDDPTSVILLPARGDCQKFLMCSAGYAFEMECPTGLEFAVLLNRCDYPNVAKCSSNGW